MTAGNVAAAAAAAATTTATAATLQFRLFFYKVQ
jgi:hypothetical protein